MKVFKFGGASVSSPERIRLTAKILEDFSGEKILIVVSAMGKTTNALEKVADCFFSGDLEQSLSLFGEIKSHHNETCHQLGISPAILEDFYTEIEWLLHDRPVRSFDYYYDQIVCIGELLSTAIVAAYLDQTQNCEWIDVRDIIRTDNNFRDAAIDWTFTEQRVQQQIIPRFLETDLVLTQGFIGATDENESTTLGREGSDYTAAVFANILNAESQTIWKDVSGVMNADPKHFPDAVLISQLNYAEVIEMAFYGAQVIHPKTIKPLQNKGIPLYVRSFLNPGAPGTCIHNHKLPALPPIIVEKKFQALVNLRSKDFSFVGEELTALIFRLFGQLKIKPNLTQNAAVSIECVLDDHPEKIEQFAMEATAFFDVTVARNLMLLTIRHGSNELLTTLIGGRQELLRQQTPQTVQVLLATP